MAASTLGLLFEIGADPSKAGIALEGFGYAIDKYIGAAHGTMRKTAVAFQEAAKDLMYLGGAAAGVAVGAIALAKRWSDAGTAIYQAAEKTGLSAEKLSGLRVAAMRNNESFETLQVTLARMERNLSVGLANPASETGKILLSLMGNTKALNDLGLLPMDQRIAQVTKHIYDLNDIGDRNRALTALMGRGWMQVNSTLQDLGDKGYDPLIARAKVLNQFFDAEAAARARQFGFELAQMKIQVEALAMGVGNKLVPVLSQLLFLTEVKLQQSFGKNLVQATRDAAAGIFRASVAFGTLGQSELFFGPLMDKVTLGIAGGAEETKGLTDKLVAQRIEVDKLSRALKGTEEGHGAVAKTVKEEAQAAKTAAAAYEKLCRQLEWIASVREVTARTTEKAKKVEEDFAKISDAQTASMVRLGQASWESAALLGRGLDSVVPHLTNAQLALLTYRSVGVETFQQLGQALGYSIAQALVYSKSIGAAMAEATKAVLANIAAEALVRAIFEFAKGFACLFWNPAEAAAHFQSAALFGSIAGVAATVGRALPTGTKPAGAEPYALIGAGGTTAGVAVGAAAAPQQTVQIIFQGPVYGGQAGIDELARAVSEAVTERDVNLVAYTVVRQPATRA